MTSRDNLPEVTILCEDLAQERFIREYLKCRGWDDRKIKDFGNPKGRIIQNNNAWVVKNYPDIVRSYRRSCNSRNIAVVVMIDADERSDHHILRSLHTAFDETVGNLNRDSRSPTERVAIFVPARNIETWFFYINHYQSEPNCDEMTDYKNSTLKPAEQIKLAQSSARILAKEICPRGIDRIALPSLCHACRELERLYL